MMPFKHSTDLNLHIINKVSLGYIDAKYFFTFKCLFNIGTKTGKIT